MAAETIVIIDDDKSFTEAAALLLEEYGYIVHQAPTGQAGVQQSLQRQPDLVIIDAHLPDMHGADVAREIHQSLPAHPLIMISSDESAGNVGRCMAVKPAAFLPKGLVAEELPALIARTMDDDHSKR